MNYETGEITKDRLPGAQVPPSRRRLVIAAVVVVLLAVIGWAIWGRGDDKAATAAAAAAASGDQLAAISVMVPGRTTVSRDITSTGSLAARREMPVGVAGEGGIVTRVLVEPGQWVAAGQVLATVDRSVQTQTAASLAAQVSVARADADLAQAELQRAAQLVDRGFISKADLQRRGATRDAANARVKVAQASLAEARARNGRLDIRAPAAGLVLARQVEAGQIVSSGSGALFRLAQNGQMEMRAQMSESDLQGMHVGAPARVTPVGSPESFSGEVWQVAPVIDPSTRQGIARIAVKYDPALRPGGFASATVTSGSASVPLLPESSVLTDASGNFVYIVGKDDKVVRRPVKIGQGSDTGIPVVSGLTGTERVVISAGAFLNPGQKIKPVLQARKG